MYDFDPAFGASWLTAAMLAAFGAALGHLSSRASAVASGLGEDEPLLPAFAREMASLPRKAYSLSAAMTATAAMASYVLGIASVPVILVFLLIAVPICAMDMRIHAIPEELTWCLLFTGALMSPWHAGAEDAVMGAAIAAAAVWLAMATVEYGTGTNTRSGGDIAAAAAGGAWVGFHGSGVYVLCACLLFMTFCIRARTRDGDSWAPMGPALVFAAPVAATLTPVVENLVWRMTAGSLL